MNVLVLEKLKTHIGESFLEYEAFTFEGFLRHNTEAIVLDTRKINLDNYPKLKIISRVGVGLDNIDLEECRKRNIAVFNTPCKELTNAVVEFTIKQVLEFLRRSIKGYNLYGSHIGIIGIGRIGKKVNELFRAFGCFTTSYDLKGLNHFYNPLEAMLDRAKIICIHISGTDQVIGEEEISKMNNKPIIVNMAREECVDEEAIYEALINNKISGFISDVNNLDKKLHINELLPIASKILITPHIASSTVEAREAMERMAFENILRGAFSNG